MSLEETLRVIVREELRAVLRDLPSQGPAVQVEGAVYLTTQEAADLVQVRVETIRDWLNCGELPSHGPKRALRVRRDQLEAFMAAGAGAGTSDPEVDSATRARAILAGRIGRAKRVS